MQFNWKKCLAASCLSLAVLMPFAEAAEPTREEIAANWKLINRASDLASERVSYDMKLEFDAALEGNEDNNVSINISANAITQTGIHQNGHTEGEGRVEINVKDYSHSYTTKINEYGELKGSKLTKYVKYGNMWTKTTIDTKQHKAKKFREALDKYLDIIDDYTDAVVVGEENDIVELQLIPRQDVVKPHIAELTDDQEILAMWQKLSQYFVDATPANVDTHLFINRKTGEFTSIQTNLSQWVKEELAYLNTKPALKSENGLSDINLAELDGTLTIKVFFNNPPADYVITIPSEIKKNAKDLKKQYDKEVKQATK